MIEFIAPKPTQDYKVVIKCMTYNQEKYIEDALKGFVRQKTNFPFCAIVVDDCSTDNNATIIREYEQKYPDIIKGIYLPVNMYCDPKKLEYVEPWIEKAQYVASCEGDDYWIDDHKLQRQVDFLDSHPNYMMHFHNALVRYQNHDRPDRLISTFKTGDFDTALLFDKWQLPLASVVFRKEILTSQVYKELIKVHNGGICYFIASSRVGKVYGLSECLSVYRKNDGGVSNKMSPAYCLQAECAYAIASKDSGAINVMRKKAINKLTYQIPKILKKDKNALELAKVANGFDKYILFKAFIRYFFKVLPLKLYNKVKRK